MLLGKKLNTSNPAESMARLTAIAEKVAERKTQLACELKNKTDAEAEIDGATRIADAFELGGWIRFGINHAKTRAGLVKDDLSALFGTFFSEMKRIDNEN